jgi:hypothetical protein
MARNGWGRKCVGATVTRLAAENKGGGDPVDPVDETRPSSSRDEDDRSLWPEVRLEDLSEIERWTYEKTGEVYGVRLVLPQPEAE